MLHLHNLKSCSYHIPSKMYGGDEGEATGEDLELERYGLTEGQYSGSGESDTEEALYRQVHYDIGNDNNIQSITEEDTKPSFGTSEDTLLPSSRDSPDANPGKDNNDGTSIDISDVVVASDDDDCHDWKRVESNSKYNVSIRTKTKPGIADISLKSGRKRKAVVVVSDSAESDIIFLESKTKSQETLKKEGNSNLGVKTKNQDSRFRETLPKEAEGNPRKRSWRNTSDDGPTKITKIDRTGWSSAHEGPEGKAGMSETSKVVIIADDSSSSSVLFLDSERSEEDGSQPKGRPLKDDTEFFLDNKGMALEDVQRDKVSAEQGWKAERMKTKAMLKEGVDIIDVSSGDEDCMVIESCSEEEGLHVHFDEKGERISPGASTSSANNSGKNRGKRKGGEIAAPGRYFVQSRQKHIRCHNCNEMGHLKSECPQPPHVPACILCGKRGHTDRYCPDALCFNCSLPGHQSRSCPVKRHIRYAKCTRCQMNGHLRKMCPDIWRQYHLTTEHGPIIKPNNTHHRSKRRDMYCSNCSRKGHRYYDCRSEKLDEFVVFTYDKVCFYDRKHIGKMVYPAENKNADYLKLCRERKSGPTLSTKDQTTLHQGDEPKSITIEDLPPLTKKRKLTEEAEDREEETSSTRQEPISKDKELNAVQTFVRKREASSSTQQEPTCKDKELNAVQTFVRKREASSSTQQEPISKDKELNAVQTFVRKREASSSTQQEPISKDKKLNALQMFVRKREESSSTQQEPISKDKKLNALQMFVRKRDEPVRTQQEPISKDKKPNTVQTFVRTHIFGGKKGRTWAQEDEPVLIPSTTQQKVAETVSDENVSINITGITKQKKIGKITIPNTVQTFVRTRLFGGKKGRTWAQQEDAVMIPSRKKRNKQKETETVSEGGSVKLKLTKKQRAAERLAQRKAFLDQQIVSQGGTVKPTKKQRKAQKREERKALLVQSIVSQGGSVKLTKKQRKEQRRVLREQKRQEAMPMRLIPTENVDQELAEARQIKHSAVLALNAVKREIKAALTKKKEKEQPVPLEVTAAMSKSEKKKWNKRIRREERKEIRLALEDRKRTDVEIMNIDQVFKDARKLCKDVNKQKRRMYTVPTGNLPGLPAEEQYPVWDDPGYAMSHRGFNLDNRLLEGTRHRDNRFFEGTHYHDNRWTMPQTAPWEEAFPRSDLPYNNYRTFIDQPYGYGPAEGPYHNSHALTVPPAHSKNNLIKGKSRHKQWFKEGYERTKTKQSFLDIDDRDDDYPRESITEQHLTRKKSRSWTEPQSVQKFGDEMAKGRNKDRMQTEPTDLPKLFSFEIGLPGSVSEDKGDDVSMRKSIAEQQLTKKKRKSRTELKNVPKSGGKKAKASNKNGTLTEPTDLPKLFSSEIGLPGYVSEGKGDDVSMRKSIAEQQLTKKKRKSLTELKNVPKSGSKKAKASNKNRTLTEPTDLPKLFSSEIGFPGYVPEGKGDDVSMRKSITGQQLTKKKRKSRPEANSVLMSGAKKTEVLKKNRTKADVQKTSSLSSETVLTVSFPEDKGDYDSSKTNDAKQTTKKNISKNGQNTKCDGKEVETREKERTSTEINNVQKSGGIQSNQKNRTREETNVIPKCKEKKKKKKRGKKKKSQDQTEQSNDEQFRDKKSQASSKQQSDITPTTKSAKRKKRRRKAVTDLSDGALPSLCPYKVENDILQTSKERSWAKKALKPINRSISILNQKVKTNKGHKALDIQEYRAGLEKAKHSAKLAILAAMHRFHEAKERKREFIKAGVSPECFCKAQQKMREALTKAKRRCPKSSNQGYAPVELGSSRMSQEQRREFLCYNSLKQGTFNLGPVT